MEYLKDLMEKYEEAKVISDKWDELFEADPMNEEIEKEWSEAYSKYHHYFVELTKGIVRESDNQIDAKTARKMIVTEREKLKEIINKL